LTARRPPRPTLAQALQRAWWAPQPGPLARLLQPLAALVHLAARHRAGRRPEALPVPVVVVGNLVVGGAGKTPVTMALVQALGAAGWRPGVVSRGYGREAIDATRPLPVSAQSEARTVGDEPLLIHRRTGVPVWVGSRRVAVARALLAAHPEVDLIVSDDGLQHRALPRVAEVLVFDERGAGNGLLLPAGPLREPLPAAPGPMQRVVYTGGAPSTPLPGVVARRRLGQAVPLAAWHAGRAGPDSGALPLPALRGRPLRAAAGIAVPERFFAALRAAGLDPLTYPLPDHDRLDALPWPVDCRDDVLVTEKDAVKLDPARLGRTPVWVVPLDLDLTDAFVADVLAMLPPLTQPPPPPPPPHTVPRRGAGPSAPPEEAP
jgi:tetraacyldisaccharide 4'-kinase